MQIEYSTAPDPASFTLPIVLRWLVPRKISSRLDGVTLRPGSASDIAWSRSRRHAERIYVLIGSGWAAGESQSGLPMELSLFHY